jgi:hypothetical protein
LRKPEKNHSKKIKTLWNKFKQIEGDMLQSQEKLGVLKQDWEKELLMELIQDVESELREISIS